MYEFKYHRPATVRQAANLLVKNEDAKLIAGGHTLVPVMSSGSRVPRIWSTSPTSRGWMQSR